MATAWPPYIAITRPSSGTLPERPLLARTPPSSYPFLLPTTRRCGLLAASGAHPPCAIPTPPFLRWVALSREMPASLALLPRPGSPPPNARCQPPCPYSPAPGRPPPTRGASLLGPTPAASQSKLLSYSRLLPPTRGGARAAPSAPSCPFSPRASRGSRHPARARRRPSWPYITPPMPEEEGPSRVLLLTLPFFTPHGWGDPPKPTRPTREARVQGVE